MGNREEPQAGVRVEKLDDSLVLIEAWGLVTGEIIATMVSQIHDETLAERFDLAVDMARVTQVKPAAAATWSREMTRYKGRLGTAYLAGKPNPLLRMMVHAANIALGYRVEFVDDLSAVIRGASRTGESSR